MSDAVTVNLTFLSVHKKELDPFLEDYGCGDMWDDDDNIVAMFYDVNYGELGFLPDLQKQGIAYDSAWDAGHEFEVGTEYCRYTPEGEMVIKTIYDRDINPCLYHLKKLINAPDRLREFILEHDKKLEVLPWDNQVEYGKIYRTRQLITS